MPRRYEAQSGAIPSFPMRLGTALRNALRHGYITRDLRSDLLAGIAVVIATLQLKDFLGLTVARLHGLGMFVVLGGVQGQPLELLARSGIREHRDQVAVYGSMEQALAAAREVSEKAIP
jgi:hypothetical protein